MKSVNAGLGMSGNGRNKRARRKPSANSVNALSKNGKPRPLVNAKPAQNAVARNVKARKPSVNHVPLTQSARFKSPLLRLPPSLPPFSSEI